MYSSNIESIMKNNTFVIIVSIMALSCYENKKINIITVLQNSIF